MNELVRRFSHRCCASISELEATDRRLTREGLVRESTRHVKDDARAVDDFTARILGWSTDCKIAALKQQITVGERLAHEAVLAGPWMLEQERIPPVEAERALRAAFA